MKILKPALSKVCLLDLLFDKSKYCKLSKAAFLMTSKQINRIYVCTQSFIYFYCLFWFGWNLRDILYLWEIPSGPPSSYLTSTQPLNLAGLTQDIMTGCSLSEKRFLPLELYMYISQRMLREEMINERGLGPHSQMSVHPFSPAECWVSLKVKKRKETNK